MSGPAPFQPPGLGCARCGTCCDPVMLPPRSVALLEAATQPAGGNVAETRAFAAEHWHRRGEADEDGWVAYDCDQFDPGSRLCRAGDARPPVCRGFPWYGDGPTATRALGLPPHCSYLLDVPLIARPDGARPLIPIMAISKLDPR